MLTLWRMVKFGLQNFWRNIWLSVITVVIVVLNLFLMTLVTGLNVVGQQTLVAVKHKVNLSVYFQSTVSEQRVEEVRQDLLRKPEVDSITLTTREQHLAQLRASQHDRNGQKLVNAAIDALGENPLGAGLVITAKTLDGYPTISKYLDQPQYMSIIEDTGNNYETNQKVISQLSGIVHRVQSASLWLTVLFALIAVMMVFNTIRVNIYSQREEIGIMKLVGATDAFVRGPFLITSLLYGLLASIITTLVFLPILSIINPSLISFFGGYDINVLAYFQQHIWTILALEISAGCGLSALSSLLAIGRYLRV